MIILHSIKNHTTGANLISFHCTAWFDDGNLAPQCSHSPSALLVIITVICSARPAGQGRPINIRREWAHHRHHQKSSAEFARLGPTHVAIHDCGWVYS